MKGSTKGRERKWQWGKRVGEKERKSHAVYICVTIICALRMIETNDVMPCTYLMIIA